MKQPDMELARLRSELNAARQNTNRAKGELDRLSPQRDAYRNQLQSINASIADLKNRIASERDAIRICKQARDYISASSHRFNLQSFQSSLQMQYSIKNDCISQMGMSQSDFDSALSTFRAAKERQQRAKEAYQARLDYLKAQRAEDASKWKDTTCKKCGKNIRYCIDWIRIPDMCPNCRSLERSKWRETSCRCCGGTIRYNIEWEHIPSVCKPCKARRNSAK